MLSLLQYICNLFFVIFLLFVSAQTSLAHNGEDHSHNLNVTTTHALPTAEAESEQFELVVQANMPEKQLLFYLDDFATNRPIEKATLEVEIGTFRGQATEVETGVYQLKAPFLNQGPNFPLAITIHTTKTSDLLALTLKVPPSHTPVTHTFDVTSPPLSWPIAGFIFILGISLGGGIFWLMGRRASRLSQHKAIGLIFIITVAFPLILQAHHATAQPIENAKPIFVEKRTQRFLGIRTQVAQLAQISQTVTLQATVVADTNHSGKIQANQSGRLRLKGVPLYIGQHIKKDQIVGELQPTLTALEKSTQTAQLADLKQQISIAEQKLNRYSHIPEVIPQKEITTAHLELQGLRARAAATAKAFQQAETLRAPISGFITALNMTHGQVVNAGDILLEMTAPQGLLIEAIQFETKQALSFEQASLTYEGQQYPLLFLGKSLKRREQGQPFLFGFQTGKTPPTLQIGQPLTITLTLKEKQIGFQLPQSSLTKNKENEDIVFIHEHAQLFRPYRVKALPLSAEMIFIPKGMINERDRVVVQGAAALAQKN